MRRIELDHLHMTSHSYIASKENDTMLEDKKTVAAMVILAIALISSMMCVEMPLLCQTAVQKLICGMLLCGLVSQCI